MAAAAAPNAGPLVTIDIAEVGELLENEVRDQVKQALLDYMEADDGMYRFHYYGKLRGLERSMLGMWQDLLTPNVASWKYVEGDVKVLDNRDWMGLTKPELDKWNDYLPIFEASKYGPHIQKHEVGMYAPNMHFPLRMQGPLCLPHTKYVVDGKVSSDVLKSSAHFANAEPRTSFRICEFMQVQILACDIDPLHMPAGILIGTDRRWQHMTEDDWKEQVRLLREAGSSVHKRTVKSGKFPQLLQLCSIRKCGTVRENSQMRNELTHIHMLQVVTSISLEDNGT
jgi:hypothetical protein